jgi:hypothetical protein
MPGPDYPWAQYFPGATWRPRVTPSRIQSVVVHGRSLNSPQALQHLLDTQPSAYHYVVTAPGAIIQLIPERGWTPALGPARTALYADPRSIAIALDCAENQPEWPPDQTLGLSRLLSVIFSVRGVLPVRDAHNVSKFPHRFPELRTFPWHDLHARIVRLDTPLDRLHDAAAQGADPPGA